MLPPACIYYRVELCTFDCAVPACKRLPIVHISVLNPSDDRDPSKCAEGCHVGFALAIHGVNFELKAALELIDGKKALLEPAHCMDTLPRTW